MKIIFLENTHIEKFVRNIVLTLEKTVVHQCLMNGCPYIEYGPSAFLETCGNGTYSSEFKEKAVLEYLSGEGSYQDIAAKYNLCQKLNYERGFRWIMPIGNLRAIV